MLEISEARLEERLRQAEDAEGEIHKLQSLASEAPQLRLDKAKQDLQEEQDLSRQNSIDQARK